MVDNGGEETVYRALDRLTGAYVALKQVALSRREDRADALSTALRSMSSKLIARMPIEGWDRGIVKNLPLSGVEEFRLHPYCGKVYRTV